MKPRRSSPGRPFLQNHAVRARKVQTFLVKAYLLFLTEALRTFLSLYPLREKSSTFEMVGRRRACRGEPRLRSLVLPSSVLDAISENTAREMMG